MKFAINVGVYDGNYRGTSGHWCTYLCQVGGQSRKLVALQGSCYFFSFNLVARFQMICSSMVDVDVQPVSRRSG